MSALTPDLAATLDVIAAAAPELADDWWVFGSAGMALAGVAGLSPPDVDLIVSERDARRLMALWGITPAPASSSELFRSAIFAKARIAPLPIEIMAGFEVKAGGAWTPVRPRTRVPVAHAGGAVFIPSALEQAEICRLFGRPKDLARLSALEALA
jgi:hypothetical protein